MAYRIWKQLKSGKIKYLKTSCSFPKYRENILITDLFFHKKRESIDSYVELLQKGFGNNLGPVFLQLSPSYSEDFGKDLSLFLNHWRRTISIPNFASELRHINWFSSPYQERINIMLSKMNVAVGLYVGYVRPIL